MNEGNKSLLKTLLLQLRQIIKKCLTFPIMKMIYSKKFLEHDNPSHPECAARLTAIIDGLKKTPYDRNDVLYSSFHLFPHYPGTGSINEIGKGDGEGFTVNAPLPRGIGDNGIRMLLDEIFIPIAKQFSPNLIIFSAGFDSHHTDPLGGLQLTTNFFGEIIKKFKEIGKVVCSLEGGYNLSHLRNSVISEVGELNGTPIEFDDEANETGDIEPIINRLRKIFNQYGILVSKK